VAADLEQENAMSSTRPSRPSVNHLVLAVRDIEASHRFYCDVLGFEQCGT
jgi:catechol-2,3-dioxygenase